MAAVIRARDTQLDRNVALKILPPEMAADAENILRFHQEARAAARLDHENIARVFFCGEDQGLHFISFEFVEGDNLRTVLERRQALPVTEALHYLLQIATGLAHAAERGVVHRDIKPSNIIVSPNGRAKLVDMGLARSLHVDNGLTQSGVTLGTFDYISPEQALEPREADVRSDIYSLGCTAYHMLTGQPPVPEGTPAKKLHHHQYVPPVDPRQLNTDIPDDVAVLLARMMAKDAKDRYQKPEHLVQHLILLAQKFGTGPSADPAASGESVLFVDAALPARPRTRPWLVTGLAVAAVVALVFVLGPSREDARTPGHHDAGTASREEGVPRQPADGATPPTDHAAPSPALAVTPSSRQATAPLPRHPVPLSPRDGRELADILAKHETTVVTLDRDFDLKKDEQLLFDGDELTLQGAEGKRPTIRLKYDGSRLGEPWAALTVRGRKVKLIGLRFEIDARESSELIMSAIAQFGGHVTLEQCEFVQVQVPETGAGSLSSVTVAGPTTDTAKPILILNECLFVRGQRAVTLTGAGTVKPTGCAFGPHTAATFHVQGTSRPDAAEVRLASCSLFVVEGAVLRLQDGAGCHFGAANSIFSRPEGDAAGAGSAALVQLTGSASGTFRFIGQRNCWHNLPAYWARTRDPENAVTRWADFRRQFAGAVQDEKSVELAASPWADPDALAALDRNDYRRAFEANTRLAQLRQVDDAHRMVGVVAGVWGRTYDTPLPLLDDRKPVEAVARKDKVVDPTVRESRDGVYPTLGQALGEAKPGEIILIKHNGRLLVETLRLEKPTVDLTIKPYPGHRPVLTLGTTTEADAALFRLHDGQLRLEGLEFYLQPRRADFKGQTIVALVGDGQCVFKDCVATLEETREVPVSLVTLTDPSGVMRMGPAPPPRQQGPRIRVEDCFVRGAGDLVAVRPSRPFDLRVDDSLVVLDGSLLYVEGAGKEPAAHPPVQLGLKKVTAYLTDHAFLLRACREEGKNARGLVHTQMMSVRDCLFASSGGKSLVHLDGVDTDDQMRRLFTWGEGQHNAYSNFAQLLDQQPREPEAMSLPPYDKRRWEQLTQETDGKFDKVKFASPPGEGMLARVLPADFRIKAESELHGYGADMERLPKPADEAGEAVPSE
jgi:tRNA A-37 threonylcarbamoyl transferase component Bud32